MKLCGFFFFFFAPRVAARGSPCQEKHVPLIHNVTYKFGVHSYDRDTHFQYLCCFFFPLQMTSVAADYSIPVGGGGTHKINCFAELENISRTRCPYIMLNISILDLL